MRRTSDRVLGLVFLAGSTSGALLLVPVLLIAGGLLSPIPTPIRLTAAVLAAAVIVTAGASRVRLRFLLPQRRWQIPPEVIATRSRRGVFRFSFALGSGLFTYLPSSSPHLLAALLVILAPGPGAVIAAAMAFGAGRGVDFAARAFAKDRAQLANKQNMIIERTARLICPAFIAASLVASSVLS